jgi:hypothetical protein
LFYLFFYGMTIVPSLLGNMPIGFLAILTD